MVTRSITVFPPCHSLLLRTTGSRHAQKWQQKCLERLALVTNEEMKLNVRCSTCSAALRRIKDERRRPRVLIEGLLTHRYSVPPSLSTMVQLNLLAAVLSALALVSSAASISGPGSARDLSSIDIVTTLPAGATAFGSDNDTDWTVAYDKDFKALGRLKNEDFHALIHPDGNSTQLAARNVAHGRRCTGLSVGELRSLPVWSNLDHYVKNTLASRGRYNVWTNWDGSNRATACVADDHVSIERTGRAQCKTGERTFNGNHVGRTGVLRLEAMTGSATTVKESVTRAASIGSRYTVPSIDFDIPCIGEANSPYRDSASFSNELHKGFEKTISRESTRSVDVRSEPGDYCSMIVETTTCQQESRGRVGFVADGYVRFGFDSRVKNHSYWHLPLARESADTRTSYMEFTGSINSHGYGRYRSECRK
ncbi:unnamed protein product [Mycena citricolor]|uniref:Uncharacterized protein n=1 Tax=Mycena citricolor TaxID=2018698 RepID=A0AAD2Q7H6_9AGAR|nr:unnamed protein product [Mycena citricolor]